MATSRAERRRAEREGRKLPQGVSYRHVDLEPGWLCVVDEHALRELILQCVSIGERRAQAPKDAVLDFAPEIPVLLRFPQEDLGRVEQLFDDMARDVSAKLAVAKSKAGV